MGKQMVRRTGLPGGALLGLSDRPSGESLGDMGPHKSRNLPVQLFTSSRMSFTQAFREPEYLLPLDRTQRGSQEHWTQLIAWWSTPIYHSPTILTSKSGEIRSTVLADTKCRLTGLTAHPSSSQNGAVPAPAQVGPLVGDEEKHLRPRMWGSRICIQESKEPYWL